MIPKLNEFKRRWNFDSDHTIKPGLEAMMFALDRLGNPEQHLPFIHVSGTNGKGSTITFMETILRAHGYTTGTFTSPAVESIYDQIQYNGEQTTKEQIDDVFKQLKAAGLNGKLTDFELLTVIAIMIFKKQSPDFILFETGMGGLLDSTNVITPLVSVITSIALDHTGFLGETVQDIAKHKAGIIKQQVPVVVGQVNEEVLLIIRDMAIQQSASLLLYGDQFRMASKRFEGTKSFNLDILQMKGAHQRINASVAIEALIQAGVPLEEKYVQEALTMAKIPHRFEEIHPDVYLDGAHNPAAAQALCATIEEQFPGEKVDFIIGMLARKDIKGTLDALQPVANSFTFIEFDHPEAADGHELLAKCTHSQKSVTTISNKSIMLHRTRQHKVVVTGSLYLLANLTIMVE